MASHGPALPSRRPAPGAYDLFPQASVSTWLDGLQAKIQAGLSGEEPAKPGRPLSPLRALSPQAIDHEETAKPISEAPARDSPRSGAVSQPAVSLPSINADAAIFKFGDLSDSADSGRESCYEGLSDGMATDDEGAATHHSRSATPSQSDVIELGDSDEDVDDSHSMSSDEQEPVNVSGRSSESEVATPLQPHRSSRSGCVLVAPDAGYDYLSGDDRGGSLQEGSEIEAGSVEEWSESNESGEEDEDEEAEAEEDDDLDCGAFETASPAPAHGSETQPIDLLDSDEDDNEEDELGDSDSAIHSHSDVNVDEENPYPTPPFNDLAQGHVLNQATVDFLPSVGTIPAAPGSAYYAQETAQHQWGLPDAFAEPPSAAMLGAVLYDLSQNVLQEPVAGTFVHGFSNDLQVPPIDPELLGVQQQQAESISGMFRGMSTVRSYQAYVEDEVDEEAPSGHRHLEANFHTSSQELWAQAPTDTEAICVPAEQPRECLVYPAPGEFEVEEVKDMQSTSSHQPPEIEVEEIDDAPDKVGSGLNTEGSRDLESPIPAGLLPLDIQDDTLSPATAAPREQYEEQGSGEPRLEIVEVDDHEASDTHEDVILQNDAQGPASERDIPEAQQRGETTSGMTSSPIGNSGTVQREEVTCAMSDAECRASRMEALAMVSDESHSGVTDVQGGDDERSSQGDDSAPTPELAVYLGEATPCVGSPVQDEGSTGEPSNSAETGEGVEPRQSLLSESEEEDAADAGSMLLSTEQTSPVVAASADAASRQDAPEVIAPSEPVSVAQATGEGFADAGLSSDATWPAPETLPSPEIGDGQSLDEDRVDVQPDCEQAGVDPSSSEHPPLLLEDCIRGQVDNVETQQGRESVRVTVASGDPNVQSPDGQVSIESDEIDGAVNRPAQHAEVPIRASFDDLMTVSARESEEHDVESTSHVDNTAALEGDATTSHVSAPPMPSNSVNDYDLCEERTSDRRESRSGSEDFECNSGPQTVQEAASTERVRSASPASPDNAEGVVAPSIGQPREGTPEYRPLRHHHGRGRHEPAPPLVVRVTQDDDLRPSGAASPPPIEPPVTRSNCGYRKLQLMDGDYSATVLVPQCTLGDTEKLKEECAVQLGPPTPAEERLAQNSMPPVRQLHPVLHSKLSRITGSSMLQSYSTDMSPARDRTISADSERWHVFILEASEGSIEYERSTRRLSTRSSLFRTPEPNRDRGGGLVTTPGSRRKRSLSAVTEDGVHLSASKRSAQATAAVATTTSPLRRSSRLRGASQAPSEASEALEKTHDLPGTSSRRVTRAMKAMETGDSSQVGPSATADAVADAPVEAAALAPESIGGNPGVFEDPPAPAVSTRQRKRKLDVANDGDEDENAEAGREPPKRGFGWSLRRWFGR